MTKSFSQNNNNVSYFFCFQINNFYEIVTNKEDFYKIKTVFEKKIDNFAYSAVEWRASNTLNFDKERSKKINEVLNALDEIDDVQNIFTNAKLENQNENNRN